MRNIGMQTKTHLKINQKPQNTYSKKMITDQFPPIIPKIPQITFQHPAYSFRYLDTQKNGPSPKSKQMIRYPHII